MRRCSSQSEYDWMKVRLTAWRWKAASAVASPPAWVPVRWTRWMVGVATPRHQRYMLGKAAYAYEHAHGIYPPASSSRLKSAIDLSAPLGGPATSARLASTR